MNPRRDDAASMIDRELEDDVNEEAMRLARQQFDRRVHAFIVVFWSLYISLFIM